jgi:peroxiredoxin
LRERKNKVPKVAMNAPAPDFELADFTGTLFRLSQLRGLQNVLLVFNRGFM